MELKVRWILSYMHVLGWPALLVLASFVFERLVFLRGQPHRRPVLGWYLSVWFIASEIVSLLTTRVQGQSEHEWPEGSGSARALYMLLWITLLAGIECLAVQGWAIWKNKRQSANQPQSLTT